MAVGGMTVLVAVGVSVGGIDVVVLELVIVGCSGVEVNCMVMFGIGCGELVPVGLLFPVLAINGILHAREISRGNAKNKYNGVARGLLIRPPLCSGNSITLYKPNSIKQVRHLQKFSQYLLRIIGA